MNNVRKDKLLNMEKFIKFAQFRLITNKHD